MSQSRQLAAIMFTDIVGYTALMGKDSAKALELVRINKEIQKPLVEKHHGQWLKEMGDGALAKFGTALDAVNCSIEIQEIARGKLDAKLRIGLHLGDITIENDDVYGDGVNVASRLESIADPGGIYISESIEKAIQGQTNVQTKYLGEIKLKNVVYGVRTYALQGVGLATPEVKDEKGLTDHFWAEIQRRSVLRATLTYIVVAWLLLQIGSLAFPALGLPSTGMTILSAMLVIGFPVAVYLAWNYERSPEGFVRTTSKESLRNPYSVKQRKPLTSNLIIGVLFLVIILIYLYPQYFSRSQSQTTNISVSDKSLAVRHFDNLTMDEENQHYADGVMEAILNHLSKIEDLRVTSRTSMEQYRDSKKTIPEIAQELGVAYILEGSFQRVGERIRVTTQLIDGTTDEHVWSEQYTEPFTDIFDLMTSIAVDVAEQLEATITPEEENRITTIPTIDLDAYDLYLRGREYFIRYISGRDQEDLLNAEKLYKSAIDLDSIFALAYVGLGEISNERRGDFLNLSNLSINAESYIDSILYFVSQAIAVDPDLAEAYSLRGIYYAANGQVEKAIQDQEKASELNPNLVEPYIRMAQILHYQKSDPVRAYSYLKKAQGLEKNGILLPLILENLGHVYRDVGEYEKSEQYLRRALQLQPDAYYRYIFLLWLHCVQGKFDEALLYADTVCIRKPKSLRCYQAYGDVYSFLKEYDIALKYWALVNEMEAALGIENKRNDINEAYIYMKTGRTTEGTKMLNGLMEHWKENPWRLAEVYAAMGENGKALKQLELTSANISIVDFLPHYHVFEGLWDDPNFKKFIERNKKRKAKAQREIQLLDKAG